MPSNKSLILRRRIMQSAMLLSIALPLALSDCGSKHNNNNNNGPGMQDQSLKPTANLQNAFGLLITENSPSASLALMQRHNAIVDRFKLPAPKFDDITSDASTNALALTSLPYTLEGLPFSFPNHSGLNLDGTSSTTPSSNTGSLQKINKTTGAIESALTMPAASPNNPGQQTLPMILTIAVSPTKDVYVQFQQPFVYKDSSGVTDAYDQTKGYQCQIFQVKGGTLDQLLTAAPSANNLECLDNTHFINSWGTGSNKVFQFDSGGNVYYPGTSPNSPQTVVYKRLRNSSTTSEVINSNICVQNFLVTKLGGVFYTGNTCSGGNNGGGGGNNGYFRYVAPGAGSNVIEIARDWYQFIFDTSVADDVAGAAYDNAVFFGPYSTDGTTPSWGSACLFKFNGSSAITDASQRVSPMLSCGASSDIWDWLNLNRSVDIGTYGCNNWYFGCGGCGGPNNSTACNTVSIWNKTGWINEFTNRCQAKDVVFAGGGSQISAIKQDNSGSIYVIGAIQKKVAGQISCNVDIRGPHCVISSMPYLTDANGTAYTSTSCQSGGGTWIDVGNCNGNQTSSANCLADRVWYNSKCYLASDTGHVTSLSTYTSQGQCEQNSGTWSGQQWVQYWPQDVNYSNVTTSICEQPDYASLASVGITDPQAAKTAENNARSTGWNNDNRYNLGQTIKTNFLINGFNCQQVSTSGSSSSNNSWTSEYQSMAMVDKTTQNLVMLSLPSEQAINLWLVDNTPYYSSYDTTLRQYLLNTIVTDSGTCIDLDYTTAGTCSGTNLSWNAARRNCVNTAHTTQTTCEKAALTWRTIYPSVVMNNFETYNVAKSGAAGTIYADGLDFTNNSYKFGTIDTTTGVLTMKAGLTGTLKTIVILPQ